MLASSKIGRNEPSRVSTSNARTGIKYASGSVQEKAKQYADQKRRIGQAAAALVEDNDFLIFASGTTVHAVSRSLFS